MSQPDRTPSAVTAPSREEKERRRENYDPGTDEHRAGRPSPPIPEGSVECWNCGAVIAWEGEEPTDCLKCGEAL